MTKALATMRKTSLYELFELHAEARGERSASPNEADTVFSVESGVTPFDLEKIAADFM